jgi:predicted enzyme related to lactoylglutathione lyase
MMAKAKPKKPAAKKPAVKKPAAKKSAAKKPAAKPAKQPAAKAGIPAAATLPEGPVFRGLRSVIYKVDDLARAKTFYSTATGRTPYFDEPYYVGYDIGGFELGLDPDLTAHPPGAGGSVAYWRVDDIAASHSFLIALGAKSLFPPRNVGGPIQVAVLADPFGNLVGLIQDR